MKRRRVKLSTEVNAVILAVPQHIHISGERCGPRTKKTR